MESIHFLEEKKNKNTPYRKLNEKSKNVTFIAPKR